MVGSYGYDNRLIRMFTDVLKQNAFTSLEQNAILDYSIGLEEMEEVVTWDSFDNGGHMNFTNGGFKIKLTRHKLKYLINYYLPSGMFVVVSWVKYSLFQHILLYHTHHIYGCIYMGAFSLFLFA